MAVKEEVSLPAQRICVRCNFVSSQEVCKACVLLEGLNKGLPRLGIGKTSKAKKMLEEYHAKQNGDLEESVLELNSDSCKSKGRPCRTGLCKSETSKANESKSIDIKETNKENKYSNHCEGKFSTNISNNEKAGVSKITRLLEQYGIEETSSKVNVENGEDSCDEEVIDEDNTCAGACGSGQVGF